MGWSKEQVLDLYPEEVDPLARSILNLSGAANISKQLDNAEAASVPWMKKGRSGTFFKRKQRERARLLGGADVGFELVEVMPEERDVGLTSDVLKPKPQKKKGKA